MIIDMHNHYLPFDFAQSAPGVVLERTGDGKNTLIVGPGHRVALSDDLIDLDHQRREMARQGIDRRVLAVPPFCFQYELPAADGITWSQALNDGIAGAVRSYPESFIGFATLPLQDIPAALVELERAVVELGLVGVEIATNINGVELDDLRFDPLWKQLEARRLPVLIHPHYVAGVNRMHEYHLRNLVGNPLETALAGTRLIFGGVLDRFPNLTIILSHGGGALPGIAGRLAHGMGVRAEISIERTLAEYLGMLYYDTIVFSPDVLKNLVHLVGAEQLVIGTDAPFDMSEASPVSFVRDSSISPDASEQILANGQRLLDRVISSRLDG